MFTQITYKEAIEFLLPKHYSGRKPSVVFAFGHYINDKLSAVCTFGIPASRSLCKGICGEEFIPHVLELNRLCRVEDYHTNLSMFVAWCLKQIGDKIVVSYADTAMNHHGYIYQACNFLYTGRTKERTDKYTEGNKHSRHYDKEAVEIYRKVRSSKYRYVYFCGNKRFIKHAKKSLKYPILNYPKGDNNEDYILGEYLQPTIIRKKEYINEN